MIRFQCGDVHEPNATVTFGDGEPSEGQAVRDVEGHVTVTVDAIEPDHGDAVELILHAENDGRYAGQVHHDDDGAITLRT